MQDIEGFPVFRKLCERDLDRPARLGEELIRCSPCISRWRPLSFGLSMGMASLRGVVGEVGLAVAMSRDASATTESIESGSMATKGKGGRKVGMSSVEKLVMTVVTGFQLRSRESEPRRQR